MSILFSVHVDMASHEGTCSFLYLYINVFYECIKKLIRAECIRHSGDDYNNELTP